MPPPEGGGCRLLKAGYFFFFQTCLQSRLRLVAIINGGKFGEKFVCPEAPARADRRRRRPIRRTRRAGAGPLF